MEKPLVCPRTGYRLPHPKAAYLDSGFWVIPATVARGLCAGKLPRLGYEKLVVHEGRHFWIARTVSCGETVWSMRDSGGWTLEDGKAVLRARAA